MSRGGTGAAEPRRQRPSRQRGAGALAADHRAADRGRRRGHRRRQVDDDRAPDRAAPVLRSSGPARSRRSGRRFPRCRTSSVCRAAPVLDRVERFRLTARYRERHPGGMAHALSRLRVDPAALGGHLIFDGLRGVDEIGWAIAHLPAFALPRAARAGGGAAAAAARPRTRSFDFAEVRGAGLDTAQRDVESLLAAVDRARRRGAGARSWPACWDRPRSRECRSTRSRARRRSWSRSRATTIRPRRCACSRPSSDPWRHLIVNTAVHAPEEVAEQVARWLRCARSGVTTVSVAEKRRPP